MRKRDRWEFMFWLFTVVWILGIVFNSVVIAVTGITVSTVFFIISETADCIIKRSK